MQFCLGRIFAHTDPLDMKEMFLYCSSNKGCWPLNNIKEDWYKKERKYIKTKVVSDYFTSKQK